MGWKFALPNLPLAAVAEQNNVAFLNDVFLPFEAHLRAFARRRKASCSKQIFTAHHFGTNEAALNVRVNRPRRFLRVRAALDGPGANFRFPRGEKRSKAEQ